MNDGLPDPLSDKNGIDPDGEALAALVEAMRKEGTVGWVCSVFELCSHPLCHASLSTYFEWERAVEALTARGGPAKVDL